VTDPDITLHITPEPSDEEAAAIAAVVALLASARQPATVEEPKRRRSRWQLAGRIAAHNASPASGHRRWSDSDGWLKR
jgi:hypothetical protein